MLPLFVPAVLITLMFFLSGIEKIYFFARSTTKFSKKIGVPLTLAKFIISAVILLELVAPSFIAAYMYTGASTLVPYFKLAALALIIFTILATILYHNPLKSRESYYTFMSNISTIGGLLALYMLVK